MRITIVTPAPPRSRHGNRVTALRWARLLRQLGHRVAIQSPQGVPRGDLLVALHARRAGASVAAFHAHHPGRPIVVALTGTDLYRDLARSGKAQRSLDLAWRVVVLQREALRELAPHWRRKTRVVFQSAAARRALDARVRTFDCAVIGHMRAVKDPLRAAWASRLLPSTSRVRVLNVGAALDERIGRRALAEMLRNPRHVWLGELSPARARRILARSRVVVVSSLVEGGANVIAEALRSGVPILASRVSGNIGMLGRSYPGYFRARDTQGLARLMARAEADPGFRERLRAWCRRLAPRHREIAERDAWRGLLSELSDRSRRHASC